MLTLKATPGGRVEVAVPGDGWPISMSIGDEEPRPAWIEHQLRRGTVQTIAWRTCPPLRPGRYTVRAITPDGVTEAQLTVT